MQKYTSEAAAYRLLDRIHAGIAYKDACIDDWTTSGSIAADALAKEASWVGVEPMTIVEAALKIIAEDKAEYAALR